APRGPPAHGPRADARAGHPGDPQRAPRGGNHRHGADARPAGGRRVTVTERGPMSVWDAIAHKRAIRSFTDRPLEPDHLERILAAARRAGSSKNLQRWDFIVCRDRGHLRELAAVGPWAGHLAGAAVGIALVTPDPAAAD